MSQKFCTVFTSHSTVMLILVLVLASLVLVLVLAGPVLDKSYSLIYHATRILLY